MMDLLHTYFVRTRVGRRDYFRQLIFLTFAPISIILFSLHLFGSYGLTFKPALACSAFYVLVSAVALIVYIVKGPKKLKYIMSAFLFSSIIIQNVRLLLLASMGLHDPMLTTVNITVCYILVLIASISILPRISLVCTCINIISMFLCHYITDNSMYSQLLVIFGFTSVATTVFGFVANKLLREQQMELDDYANTIEQVLHVFNMRKNELLALLKLAKAQDTAAVYNNKELMAQLDKKTLHNIIKVANQIEHMQACQRKDMHERFPMLTPTELDVCRLVEQGLAINDISKVLGKSASNVSTVRGNIRKKLGLAQDADLRRALLDYKNV
ncbi:helix-turn-helix transcriptional regulator [uncultured Prevotella sp.]|uniref:helix-turn-helix domain-containing protein n=1 Tax=uncultured Prevotella sp. TaxID=159272 RepID=UPI0027E2B037|nr:helix-turn-helix transcriptional regulator [uncultured Prevotella sp.]